MTATYHPGVHKFSVFVVLLSLIHISTDARAGGQYAGDGGAARRGALRTMEGRGFPGGLRPGVFDGAMAFRRISFGGIAA